MAKVSAVNGFPFPKDKLMKDLKDIRLNLARTMKTEETLSRLAVKKLKNDESANLKDINGLISITNDKIKVVSDFYRSIADIIKIMSNTPPVKHTQVGSGKSNGGVKRVANDEPPKQKKKVTL